MSSSTLTTLGIRRASGRGKREHQLFLLLEAERPQAGSWRLSLSALDSLVLGRAPSRTASRTRFAGGERLLLGVPDPRMSTEHARLARVGGKWVVEDTGSKNGVLVDGVREVRVALRDGAVFELGHTSFLYREAPAGEAPSADLISGELPAPHPALATLSSALEREFLRLARVAASRVPLLVRGESGTGKELVARAVHELSGRSGPFTPVNCGELPQSLLESELFGHRRGTFSGATADRDGLVRAAEAGTLFLDEIGDLAPASQVALLRVLQEGEVRAVGATRAVPVDVRFVAATHRNLESLVERGTFRADLLARLAGYVFTLPALRERKEDLGMLAGRLIGRTAKGDTAPALTQEATRALFRYDYPLNVRELEQALAAASVLAAEGRIELSDLPQAMQRPLSPREAAATDTPEDAALRAALIDRLSAERGNVAAVARAMGRDRKQIHRWIARFGIRLEDFR